ncbi:hypothetical protein pb186bvf_003037 [Paramecium bursaria]
MGACQCLNKELDIESEGNEIEAKINKLNSMSRSTAMSQLKQSFSTFTEPQVEEKKGNITVNSMKMSSQRSYQFQEAIVEFKKFQPMSTYNEFRRIQLLDIDEYVKMKNNQDSVQSILKSRKASDTSSLNSSDSKKVKFAKGTKFKSKRNKQQYIHYYLKIFHIYIFIKINTLFCNKQKKKKFTSRYQL